MVGLGYVGLPLAIALSRTNEVWGLDIDRSRVTELRSGHDRTGEIEERRLASARLNIVDNAAECSPADFYIITVPTPVDDRKEPDLSILMEATRTVGKMLRHGHRAVVVYESTVYPGVTEDICGPELERASGLVCGRDFFLGYSPERINPGDREHTVEQITKVVSGQTPEVLEEVASLYEKMTTGGVFRVASIKAAEAAKVIENAQRDINIAFMNEITQIFAKMDISVWDVLAAARTKWNFLPFQPGLVGGHCIGVDPYYLSHRAEQLGIKPKVILAGRDINDDMERWLADRLHERTVAGGSVLVMGLTFKENVPDLRNSRVANLIARLCELGHPVTVHDPLASADDAKHEYGIDLAPDALAARYDTVFVAVPHDAYQALPDAQLSAMVRAGGLLADLKNIFGGRSVVGVRRWTL